MKQFDDTNRFVLFINKSDNPKAPTHKGKININGTEYNIAGWVKQSSSGVDYISGSVEAIQVEQPTYTHASTPDDGIPF